MTKYKCSKCGRKTCWYSYDGPVCIKCGFVGQDTVISGKLVRA